MFKRLLAVLAPIVAVAALAAMPAVSQAAPHYYRNGVLIPEGTKVPILEWGRLTMEGEPGGGVFSCPTVTGGFVENPIGGEAGIGATEAFSTYHCENVECPAGPIELAGKKYEKAFAVTYPPQYLPWRSVLIEPEAGKIRADTSGVVEQVGCYATPLTRAEMERETASGPGEDELFPLAATVTCVTTPPEHEQTPLVEKGTSAASPTKLVFDAKADTLSCAGGAFDGKTLKSLKLIGYNASELISVRNP